MGSTLFLSPSFMLLFVLLFPCCISDDEFTDELFEGDIIGLEETPVIYDVSTPPGVQMAAASRSAKKWPKGIVPYTFDSNFGYQWRKKVKEALDYFMKSVNLNGKQCIKFVERTDEEDYVKVVNGPGCYSSLGQQGGIQDISLRYDGCFSRGTIVHEFMHSLGFFHEQSRPDRDKYIKIIKENIDIKYYERNFQKYSTDTIDISNPYDYASVMHYEANAFSKNGKDTIIPLKIGTKIGQREGFSPNDIAQIRAYYSCSANKKIKWIENSNEKIVWANGCEFPGNELEEVASQGEECAGICEETDSCTHFTYNNRLGTCYLKQKAVKKSDAKNNDETFCGFLVDNSQPEKDCKDQNKNCKNWARAGECQANPNYMNIKCCKSCSSSSSSSSSSTSSSSTSGDCNKKNKHCDFWASIGECKTNPDYMLVMCCASCQQSKGECKNQHKYCDFWSSIGECEENPDYMLTKCCKSCQK